MAEQAIKGETIIEDEVVASLAGKAAGEVDGVVALGKSSIRRMLAERLGSNDKSRGVQVAVAENDVTADLTLSIGYGYNIPATVAEVRRRVSASLQENAGLNATEINIHVSHIDFPDEDKASAIKGHQH